MVLHSFILNPRNFLADCIRHGKMNLWTTGIPWQEVAAAIDNQSFAYEPGDNAKKLFESNTGRPWDNLHESPDYSLDCPRSV